MMISNNIDIKPVLLNLYLARLIMS